MKKYNMIIYFKRDARESFKKILTPAINAETVKEIERRYDADMKAGRIAACKIVINEA